ncbi:MAG: class I SAM-dependent methyltransferase [Alphaproteobacteria bacterium]
MSALDTRATYQRIAPFYDLLDFPFEYGRYRRLRARVFDGLSGAVLDAGVGTGRNMPFYPEDCQITGIDLSSAMLTRAARRRARFAGEITLACMDVCRTAFADHRFDGVVATFLFCVLSEDAQLSALGELARVCKPEGEIRILEYVESGNRRRRFVMRLLAPWAGWAYGAAFDRHTERYLSEAGLALVETRFVYDDVIKLIIARPAAPMSPGYRRRETRRDRSRRTP